MIYNWQFPNWPEFNFEDGILVHQQLDFLLKSGQGNGMLEGVSSIDQEELLLETIVGEAMKTSVIEGELLSRQDVMSSIKKNLGIHEAQPNFVKDLRAKGIAKMIVNVRASFADELTPEVLFEWHKMLMEGNRYINAGRWRSDSAPMQVVSGVIGKETVHFEAPPSAAVPYEMEAFIVWFNQTAPGKSKAILNPLLRAGIAHLYFESIHPFEDGNGRIGRALVEKVIHQGLGYTTLISVSSVIEKEKSSYYSYLSKAQKSLEITDWLNYFGETILTAQTDSLELIQFTFKKTRFFDRWKNELNERQLKAIARMLEEGPSGFNGGMTAKKYMGIAKVSKATATRDLQQLAEIGVFKSIGGGRNVHYSLNMVTK
ncbi:Fic family protein [Algoriphagus marinus]|uniref:Fic family protein n=1 Tax=Algoriphagus marinus TaxID=1925762 RepID=UPI00094BBF6B|nr:Fic family protein [Algoriphagus marinus]